MATPIVLALDFGETPFPTADEAWCVPADLADCVSDPGSIDVASVCATASGLLRNMTGGRYGVRRQTVRPHRILDGCGGWPFGMSPTPTGSVLTPVGYRGWWGDPGSEGLILDGPASVLEVIVDGAYLPPSYADGDIVAGQVGIGSVHAGFIAADVGTTISGPGIPTGTTVAAVNSGVQASMSAAATATGTVAFTLGGRTAGWYLHDRRTLVRAGDVSWPTQQDLSQPLSAPGTWAVTYESGTPPPPEGKVAAIALACDLLRSLPGAQSPGSCTPPERVSSLSRQGVTIARVDPTEYLNDGFTGVRVTDLWLASLKARKGRRRASIASPETIRGARQ